MSESERREMTWQERQGVVARVMTLLEDVDTQGGDRTSELLSLLQGAAQLLVPGTAVKFTYG